MALAHKGIACETISVHFADIPRIADRKQKTVPVIVDGDRVVGDSWSIASYLEDTYQGRPSLFGGAAGRALTLFIQNWTADILHCGIIGMILLDIYLQLDDADKAYFRTTREKRFGRALEEVQAGRENRLSDFRASLQPIRSLVAAQPWLGGNSPLYADYLVFSAFQWARVVSDFRLLAVDDPIDAWFGRCLDLFDGLGRRAQSPVSSSTGTSHV
jgi:glutathione S-transferase